MTLSPLAEKELERVMNRFLLDRLAKPLKSRVFMEKVALALAK
jgi:hypothetical protein